MDTNSSILGDDGLVAGVCERLYRKNTVVLAPGVKLTFSSQLSRLNAAGLEP